MIAVTFLLPLISLQLHAQEVVIKGKVTVHEEYGLNKVLVTAIRSGTTAYTDTAGFFLISCLKKDRLAVEANGFSDRHIRLNNKNREGFIYIDLELAPTEDAADVATGYGHISKNKLSHAIERAHTTNNFSEYASVPDIIKGRVSGVSINETSITIRGTNTYHDKGPLILVDGVAVDFMALKNMSTSQVKSVDVLKGGSATARYGSRGLEGVIIIHTKRSN